MQSRRNFIGKVATGLAGTMAARQCPGRQRPHPPRHHRPRRPRQRNHARGAGLPKRGIRRRSRHLYQAPGRCQEDRPRRQDLPRLPPPAGRQGHRRRADRHAAAPALRAFRRRARRRQARLPGKDHGVHGGPRQAHARRLQARRQAHRADRPPGLLVRARYRTPSISCKPAMWARSPPSTRTCTATRRTASRSGRGRSIRT